MNDKNNKVRLIAFYLPQYHPIPENDKWWGKGFTEWTTIAKAKPLFKGHYQPHIPADLGYYDLRLPEAREAQVQLARDHGIYGFCYYHYWFNGKRLLERPFTDVLASGMPDFPFCLCWANENWTRAWDGGNNHILISQKYSYEDDYAHIKSLFPAFRDERYIKINGKPLFLVYRTEEFLDPIRTVEIWRNAAKKSGIGNLYLVRVESFKSGVDPKSIGFDAAVEFAPDWRNIISKEPKTNFIIKLSKLGLTPKVHAYNWVKEYDSVVKRMLHNSNQSYRYFRCVTPSFDNSARRPKNAIILINSTPNKYEEWLKTAIRWTDNQYEGGERLVFINAWNEWGEGNHLEPDLKWGRAYLEATKRALNDFNNAEQFKKVLSEKLNEVLV